MGSRLRSEPPSETPSRNDGREVNATMCDFDRETHVKVSDCGHCGCGQSSKSGQHTRQATGETVQIGNEEVPTYKCRDCGTYMP